MMLRNIGGMYRATVHWQFVRRHPLMCACGRVAAIQPPYEVPIMYLMSSKNDRLPGPSTGRRRFPVRCFQRPAIGCVPPAPGPRSQPLGMPFLVYSAAFGIIITSVALVM